MELDQIVSIVKSNAPLAIQWILMGLGGLVVVGYAYVKATPTKDDDKWLQSLESKAIIGMLLKLLVSFSPVARKENLEKFDDDEAKKEAASSGEAASDEAKG